MALHRSVPQAVLENFTPSRKWPVWWLMFVAACMTGMVYGIVWILFSKTLLASQPFFSMRNFNEWFAIAFTSVLWFHLIYLIGYAGSGESYEEVRYYSTSIIFNLIKILWVIFRYIFLPIMPLVLVLEFVPDDHAILHELLRGGVMYYPAWVILFFIAYRLIIFLVDSKNASV